MTPPAVVSTAKRLQFGKEWQYASAWPAVHESWDHSSIARAQAERFTEFVALVQAPNPPGVVPETAAIGRPDASVQNTYLAFAYALARAATSNRSLRVIDWGGGLGQYYVLSRALFPELELEWVCKELPDLVELGRRLNPGVRFVTDDAELPEADFLLASSSLQYVRDWRAQFAALAARTRNWCYITRMPTVTVAADYVLIQNARRHGYHTRYPGWVLNAPLFRDEVRRHGFVLEREMLLDDGPDIRGIPERAAFRGYLFRRDG